MIEHYIVRWGYAAIVVGTFFEGETVLVLGGAMAHRGLLSLPGVALSAFAGSLAGDQLWFLLGRRGGRLALAHRLRWQTQATRVNHWITRYGTTFVVGFRFIYGLRSVSPLILGASGYPPLRFLWLNIAGAALWAMCFSALGWGLSAGLIRTFRGHVQWAGMGIGGLVLIALIAIAYRFLRRSLRAT